MDGYVYRIVNKFDGKSYIGKTYCFDRRMKTHHDCYDLTNDSKVLKSKLYRAFRKYGIENFNIIILERYSSNDKSKLKNILSERERYYIKLFNTFNSDCGYNLTSGGDGGSGIPWNKGKKDCFSKETLKRMSINNTGNKNAMYGKPRTQEVKDKVTKWNREYWSCHEPKNKIHFTQEQEADIIFMYIRGISFEEIGKKFGNFAFMRIIKEHIRDGWLIKRTPSLIKQENSYE